MVEVHWNQILRIWLLPAVKLLPIKESMCSIPPNSVLWSQVTSYQTESQSKWNQETAKFIYSRGFALWSPLYSVSKLHLMYAKMLLFRPMHWNVWMTCQDRQDCNRAMGRKLRTLVSYQYEKTIISEWINSILTAIEGNWKITLVWWSQNKPWIK